MKQQIKEKEKLLKNKEKELKVLIQKEGEQLKTKATRISKIALLSGFASLIIYSIYRSSSGEKEPKTKKIKKYKQGLITKLSKIIMPCVAKLILNYINTEKDKDKA
ncbi:MAG: hypothetical protein GDA51_03940 [Ekhidna sp.]|nr:hypothetical protein [Ekhidna sp.]MBC6409503.1 hypothetical protein [Ekhidna sp.]MBC6425618.1 hypothetical protein [Ekhidna sp.]